jgi:hypothetical protein
MMTKGQSIALATAIALSPLTLLPVVMSRPAIAYASPTGTVNLTDIPMDDYPVCDEEDCSDVPNQEGAWEDPDTGDWYLEQGEGHTWLIVDNTVTATLWLDPDTGNVFLGREDAGQHAIALPNQRVDGYPE